MNNEKLKRPAQAKADPVAEQVAGKSMAPPTFQLKASSQAEASELQPGASQSGPAAQLKGKEDPKPYKVDKKTPDLEYGAEQKGPLAVKGAGDKDAFAANDVNQGALGDCWLLSSLMTLAETQPDVLRNAITDKGDDTYDVRFYKKKGLFKKSFEAQTVNVNTSFVNYKAFGTEAYAQGGDMDHSGNEEMWVKIIEKAYAKWQGGYKKIDGGWPENALEALTGKEYEQHNFGGFLGIGKMSDADLQKTIMDALAAGQAMTAATKGDSAIKKADKDGFAAANDIVGNHAYAVMAADANGITVRNPWGSGAANAEPTLTWAQFRSFYRDFTTAK